MGSLDFVYKNDTHLSENSLIDEEGLGQAIASHELRLHYQPRFPLRSGCAQIFEALVRWDHPTQGLLLPDEFIPLAEESGLIHDLGLWVVNQACRDFKSFRNEADSDISRISINMSILQCEDPTTPQRVIDLIHRNGLSLSHFEFELTESVAIQDEPAVIHCCRILREAGAEISLDDFGTGQASMLHLSRLPVHAIKIDRAFVSRVDTHSRDRTMVRHLIHLCHDMGIKVVAEGVELRSQAQTLMGLGCDALQGFYLCRPVEARAAMSWRQRSERLAVA